MFHLYVYTYMRRFPTKNLALMSPLHSHEQRNTSCYTNSPHATFSMANFPRVSKNSRIVFNSYFCKWSNPGWVPVYFTIPGIPDMRSIGMARANPLTWSSNLPLTEHTSPFHQGKHTIQKKTPKKWPRPFLRSSKITNLRAPTRLRPKLKHPKV